MRQGAPASRGKKYVNRAQRVTRQNRFIVLVQDIDLDGKDEVVLLCEKGYLHLPFLPDGTVDDDYSENQDKYVSYEKHLKLFVYDNRLNELIEKQDIKLTDFGTTTPPYYLSYKPFLLMYFLLFHQER